ncbi:hypothetical protein VP1G_10367 [Cytospora mali]|uniref:Uncharacterized protein n=1 Tax=Cytospora mali TaxID=578113 RepID=A0A194VHH5_CYTMA|nr:hypothetical protein VP1G_10367 [Valsa mali var. pyri (nom. inval.)]
MTIYRLSVTRRCLECDHQFCLSDATTSSSSSKSPKGKKRKRARGGLCKAEFDYAGWSAHNAWRRTVLLNSPSVPSAEKTDVGNDKVKTLVWGDEYATTTAVRGVYAAKPFADRRDGLFIRRKHNCWLHCDFPSECHHAIYRAQQQGRPILAEAEALDAVNATVAVDTVEEKGGRHIDKKSKATVEREVELPIVSEIDDGDGGQQQQQDEEEEEEADSLSDDGGDDKENVSPCSHEPPSDLMCEPEVSPITPTDAKGPSTVSSKDNDSEVWDDIYLDDASDQTKPREFKIYADDTQSSHRITAEAHAPRDPLQLFSFAPLIDEPKIGEARQCLTIDDLESAYSENPWFTTSSTKDKRRHTEKPSSCTGPERRDKRDKMFALIGRRNAIATTIITPSGSTTNGRTTTHHVTNNPRERKQQQGFEDGEEWESWSDSSSSSSSSSSSCSVSPFFSRGGGGDSSKDKLVAVVDIDGDSPMPEALSPVKEEDEDMLSPVTPIREDGKHDESGLMSLLRMRSAFMRGEI